jgi:hypothetical protein
VRNAIRLLPPPQQAALALYYFEELSVGEVAVALDIPVGTVKTRLLHARRSLNKHCREKNDADDDDLVDDALSADEREILRRIGPEPGLVGMATGCSAAAWDG